MSLPILLPRGTTSLYTKGQSLSALRPKMLCYIQGFSTHLQISLRYEIWWQESSIYKVAENAIKRNGRKSRFTLSIVKASINLLHIWTHDIYDQGACSNEAKFGDFEKTTELI